MSNATLRVAEETDTVSMPKFKPGDLVRLQSGGPVMTVSGFNSNANVNCVWMWFEGSVPDCAFGSFAPGALVAVEEVGHGDLESEEMEDLESELDDLGTAVKEMRAEIKELAKSFTCEQKINSDTAKLANGLWETVRRIEKQDLHAMHLQIDELCGRVDHIAAMAPASWGAVKMPPELQKLQEKICEELSPEEQIKQDVEFFRKNVKPAGTVAAEYGLDPGILRGLNPAEAQLYSQLQKKIRESCGQLQDGQQQVWKGFDYDPNAAARGSGQTAPDNGHIHSMSANGSPLPNGHTHSFSGNGNQQQAAQDQTAPLPVGAEREYRVQFETETGMGFSFIEAINHFEAARELSKLLDDEGIKNVKITSVTER